ncbi:MAG: response regulator [Fimbriimonas sp.]
MAESFDRWFLVVEDNPDDEHLARRAFGLSDHAERLLVARNGEEALKVLAENPSPIFVLLDLKLPRLSGVEVLMAMKDDERLRTIPVVVFSSSNERSDVGACYDLGCSAFVRKPLDYEEFIATFNTMLTFWLSINITNH